MNGIGTHELLPKPIGLPIGFETVVENVGPEGVGYRGTRFDKPARPSEWLNVRGGREFDRIFGPTASPNRTCRRSSANIASEWHPLAVGWATLGRRAKAWRVVHAAWSVAQLACLGNIYASAVTGRRSPGVWAGVAFLSLEGVALVMGRGNCPVGPLQAEWGDPVPFFELLLPPRAAKAAIPVLTAISVVGIGALVFRPPGLVLRAPVN